MSTTEDDIGPKAAGGGAGVGGGGKFPSRRAVMVEIEKWARRYNIPIGFALAVCDFESTMGQNHSMWSGPYIGPMQVSANANWFGLNPHKWQQNVEIGVRYLRNLHDHTPGIQTWHDTYAAYNAGPSNWQNNGTALHNASEVVHTWRTQYDNFGGVGGGHGHGGGNGGHGGGHGGNGGGGHGSSQLHDFIHTARRQIGDPYIWGDTGPNGFDCSGLVDYALAKAGVHVPGRLTAQGFHTWTDPVSKKQLQRGDLVFFNYGRLGAGQADHVGIYLGNGKMIAASSSADKVQVQSVDWSAFIGGGQIPHLHGQAGGGGGGDGGGAGGGNPSVGPGPQALGGKGHEALSPGELASILRGYGLSPHVFSDLIDKAVREQWSPAEFTAKLYGSDVFQKTFPGIFNKDGSLKMTPSEYLQLAYGAGGFSDIARNFGIKLDRDRIGVLIGGDVSPDEWANRALIFQTAKSNDIYRQSFNSILKGSGNDPVKKNEWFDFIAGKPEAKIYDLYEAASLQAAPGLNFEGTGKGALKAAGQIGKPGEFVDIKALIQTVQQQKDFIAPELTRAGITDADLAVLAGGQDPKGIKSTLEGILRSRQALSTVSGQVSAAGGGLFPAAPLGR
jgi:hypothetical protein